LIGKFIEQIQKEDKQTFKNLNPKIVAHSILEMYNSAVIGFDKGGKISLDELANMMYETIAGPFKKSKPRTRKKQDLAQIKYLGFSFTKGSNCSSTLFNPS